MKVGNSNKQVANGLVALSSAAILAVYTAGYLRTRSAADRFAVEAAERRSSPPRIAGVERVVEPELPRTVTESEAPARPVARAPRMRDAVPVVTPKAPASNNQPAEQIAEAPALAPPVDAPPAAPEPPAPPVAQHAQYKDGTYYGWGTSRHGDIQAAVVVQDGKIASATIAQCLTRYSCSVIARLPPQVAARQSPEIDYVSGATQSTNAFYYAVVEALAKAR